MNSLKQQALQKWQSLATREQKLLMAALPVTLFLSFYLAITGLIDWQSNLQKQVSSRTMTLTEMQTMSAIIKQDTDLQKGNVDSQIIRAGKRYALWDKKSVYQQQTRQAELYNQSFTAVVSWLASLEQNSINTQTVQLTRSESGRVSGNVTFQGDNR